MVSAIANGCSQTISGSSTVTVNALPTATVVATSPICTGENAVFTITGTPNAVVTYNLNGGSNTTVTFDSAGSATVTVNAVTTSQVLNAISASNPATSCAQNLNGTATVVVEQCACHNDPNTSTAGLPVKHGITLLKRAGADNGNWPMLRNSAHTALESNVKGFVITRIATADLPNITNPVEGMMVYDTTAKCLKLFADGVWSCFNTPACQ
ncbi:hypothetical protein MTP09_02960 [Chryseobacterium suipulveris]|uniref:Ig-like domain-containing protein n=1 Tax=Chryseobacterium suipulveris TaxID=2929800 RepID=A0ABY4BQY6_9FLAO|nr:hypothetical protein [Chryseobacterium suipulveris]UOE41613.1 hypothetical protein MTP09_02960 [Chryseobacterium suipulveris]